MVRRTRCHAAVINGKVLRNIVVAYEGTPSCCTAIEIKPFIGETHSTDDFNGAVVVTPLSYKFHPEDYTLTIENFSMVLGEIAADVPSVTGNDGVKLFFMEL